ncbi:MAG: imidazole glycerol phosphate synthase subunit HisH [Rhodocyclaceae bacterium]|jgi:glutamine amidotransferase|nr:imidazole glycerol phosphate synthase subunit HisH [Rhodocyclaceae bacterium]
MNTVAIVDYGMGNLRSVAKAIEHVARDARILVTSDPKEVAAADRVVVPGQGAMPDCMRELDARGLRDAVIEATQARPFLGICIGLQMLFGASEEGNVAGLGVLPGQVRRFPREQMVGADGSRLKVPHMGWNEVNQAGPHALWEGIASGTRFYFVHSYYVEAGGPSLIAAFSVYGIPFTCAVAKDNIFAVQFHPEKSADAGLKLLGNFMRWKP